MRPMASAPLTMRRTTMAKSVVVVVPPWEVPAIFGVNSTTYKSSSADALEARNDSGLLVGTWSWRA
jgi:hypothetical protein